MTPVDLDGQGGAAGRTGVASARSVLVQAAARIAGAGRVKVLRSRMSAQRTSTRRRDAPRVSLYWNWPYVLVQAGPEQALAWRTGGHIRHPHGALPDLFFPADRSWLVSALWDDTWTCVGGPAPLIHTLERDPVANARQVQLGEDALPPGLVRE